MSSGVEPDENVSKAFKDMKSSHQHAYLVMKISEDKKKIVIETKGDTLPSNCTQSQNEELFNKMKKSLGKKPRYILFDSCFTRTNQTVATKLVFISWCSDDFSSGEEKMLHASSKGALKKLFTGINTPEFQYSQLADMEFSEIVKDLLKRDRS